MHIFTHIEDKCLMLTAFCLKQHSVITSMDYTLLLAFKKDAIFLCKESRSLKLTRLYLCVFLYSILC